MILAGINFPRGTLFVNTKVLDGQHLRMHHIDKAIKTCSLLVAAYDGDTLVLQTRSRQELSQRLIASCYSLVLELDFLESNASAVAFQ
jgi:hypothetical protein